MSSKKQSLERVVKRLHMMASVFSPKLVIDETQRPGESQIFKNLLDDVLKGSVQSFIQAKLLIADNADCLNFDSIEYLFLVDPFLPKSYCAPVYKDLAVMLQYEENAHFLAPIKFTTNNMLQSFLNKQIDMFTTSSGLVIRVGVVPILLHGEEYTRDLYTKNL
jgi:hypothetical protein